MDFKITKIRKYGNGIYCSEKIGVQYYNVVYARLYPNSKDKNTFYKVHFIHMFDGEDLWEFFNGGREDGDPEKETFSKLIKRMQLTLRKNSGILMASNIGEGYNDDDERTRTNTDGASYRAG